MFIIVRILKMIALNINQFCNVSGGIILKAAVLLRLVCHLHHVALVIIGKACAIFFFIKAKARKVGIVAVAAVCEADIHTYIVMLCYKGGVHELPFTAVCPELRIVDVIPVIGITGYEVDMEAKMAVLPAV